MAKWILAFVVKRAIVLQVLTWVAVVFSGVLVLLGVFWNRELLPWGIAGAAWKLTFLFFGGWLLVRFRKFLERRVANGRGNIPADPE